MAERKPEVEINFSMQNMVDSSTLWGIISPIELHTSVAKKSGYDGIEYYPYRIPHIQVATHLITQQSLELIHSAHESFRTEQSIRAIMKHPNPKLAAQVFFTMPEKYTSLKDLSKLQKVLGIDIPVIVYPPNDWMGQERPELHDILRNKLIQPAPELINAFGKSMEKASGFGYKLCLDLFHIRRSAVQGFTTQFGPWQEILPTLLPHTGEIHLAVGRSDFNGPFDSAQELKDIYSGERKTDIIPMLELIRDLGWVGPIVTEIPATSAKNLISNAKIATPNMLIQAHKQIVANIRKIMSVS